MQEPFILLVSWFPYHSCVRIWSGSKGWPRAANPHNISNAAASARMSSVRNLDSFTASV